jgi:hypothetical protein
MIELYEMKGCSYCVKSKELFSDEIAQGTVVVLPSSQAPNGTKAFPFFVNRENGLTYLGYPGNKETLYNKLNAALQPQQENFVYTQTAYAPDNSHLHRAWIGIV